MEGFMLPELYLAERCRSGLAWPARSIPTARRRPGRTAPGPGTGRRRRGGWPARWCSRAGPHARGRAACGTGRCAGWPSLPPWGWRASGCTAYGPPSCALAGVVHPADVVGAWVGGGQEQASSARDNLVSKSLTPSCSSCLLLPAPRPWC